MSEFLIIFIAVCAGLLFGFVMGYNTIPKFGDIVIEKTTDPKGKDKIGFMFSRELDDLYSAKAIRLNVKMLKEAGTFDNSDNDET